MRNLVRLVIFAAVVGYLAGVSSACTNPPSEDRSRTWPPATLVYVLPDSQVDTFNALTGAINNWNAGLANYCNAPTFSFSFSSPNTQTVTRGPIPPPEPGLVARGTNDLHISGRIQYADMTVNENIPLTFPNVMTEVIAHEIGHTVGLNDCSGCDIYSNVMVTNVPGVPTWTGTQGQPGPTSCDTNVMILVAPDYACPPPPPPPPPCPDPNASCHADLGEVPADYFTYPSSGCPAGMFLSGLCCTPPPSPIIIDVNGDGFELTSAADGVMFDISGTGHPIQIAWTAFRSDDAWLCLPDTYGKCDDGKDLFGNFTPQPPSAHPNGFIALAVYDRPENGGNGDGIIDSRDRIFSSLRLWVDTNHDGISQSNELHTLPSLGVNSISLNYQESRFTDQYGNMFRYWSGINGSARNKAYDVFLVRR